ncbi:TadE family protein [Novispirillum sp. DQ9]|uniref:TadE family protein n=1 Tax=Novispirillum sp. DQ9 TaxID=3398612 RepID=UPI003C7B0CAB
MTRRIPHPWPGPLGDHGTVAVEFALLVPVLMLILVTLLDFGTAFREKMQAEKAARAGLQYAIYDPADNAGIASAITLATGLPAGQMTITVNHFYECANGARPASPNFCAAGDWPGRYVRIDISKPYTALLSWGGLAERFTVRGSAEGRVQ